MKMNLSIARIGNLYSAMNLMRNPLELGLHGRTGIRPIRTIIVACISEFPPRTPLGDRFGSTLRSSANVARIVGDDVRSPTCSLISEGLKLNLAAWIVMARGFALDCPNIAAGSSIQSRANCTAMSTGRHRFEVEFTAPHLRRPLSCSESSAALSIEL